MLQRMILAVALGLSFFTGCKPHEPADVKAALRRNMSPEQIATLKQLTAELRHTMRMQVPVNTFEEFAAARSDLIIPPPPPGKKYVINKKYFVVDLVDH